MTRAGGGSNAGRRRRIVVEQSASASAGASARARARARGSGRRWDLVISFLIALTSGMVAVFLIREELQVGRSCGLLPHILDDRLGTVALRADSELPFKVHSRQDHDQQTTSNLPPFSIKSTSKAETGLLAIRSSRVVLMNDTAKSRDGGEGEKTKSNGFSREQSPLSVSPATIVISDGKIVNILRGEKDLHEIFEYSSSTCIDETDVVDNTGENLDVVDRILDFGDLVVMAGLVDSHVHLNDPGRESWEGFHSGTHAAAAGGVTSLVDMPLNSIPSTVDEEGMTMKLAASYGKLGVDVAFWGGLINDNIDATDTENALGDEVKSLDSLKIQYEIDKQLKAEGATMKKLVPLLDSGVAGLKAFLSDPGTEEFSKVTSAHIQAAVPLLVDRELPLLVHAELEESEESTKNDDHDRTNNKKKSSNPTHYRTYSATRPPSWEKNAVRMLIDIWRKTGATSRLHIVHVSDAETVDMISEAKQMGMNITLETAPHYLYFSEDDIPMGGTLHKCAPPIRSESNREALWAAVLNRTVDMLASDHSPAPPEDKEIESGDFLKAWGGISSLQLTLPAVWTEGRPRGLSIDRLSELMSLEPAKLAGLSTKGSISSGKDADFVIWDPEEDFVVDKDYQLFHRHPQTPYRGAKLSGKVRATFVRGQLVFLDGKHSKRCCGKYLLRQHDF